MNFKIELDVNLMLFGEFNTLSDGSFQISEGMNLNIKIATISSLKFVAVSHSDEIFGIPKPIK
jgi:hypothetical protein